ncbi:CHC2 zinc finger domain-containing protein [Chitinophaga rhizosphaerae]|uniref:CHC2 zinc finger domain-containing protein n=1 Tax=Chitinophaga rhizosphaerae TaxID=1864947 RepID=UPI000F8039F9|nr:CHC2 zinc finger domain-containing protein [Chitinophaga rhizosphaerae]
MTYIPEETVTKVKEQVDLVRVIGEFTVLKRNGKDYSGDCPFCGGKFSVNPNKGIYKCWSGCEEGGNDPISFVMKKTGVDFPAAIKWLADTYNIIISEPLRVVKSASQTRSEIKKGAFLNSTMEMLGLTSARNKIWLKMPSSQGSDVYPLIAEDRDGNLEFTVYDIHGFLITYPRALNGMTRDEPYKVVRYQNPQVDSKGGVIKYRIPKGVGTRPFFPPGLLRKFREKESITTLFITEGYKKAIAGWIHGMDIVGLSSISTYRDKETLQLHRDIIELILACGVRDIVFLYDGDCRNISLKALEEGKDIYMRPNNFFSSARGMKELLKDYLSDHEISLYFGYISSESVVGNPKGLDDLYEALRKNRESEFPVGNDISFRRKRSKVIIRKTVAAEVLADACAFSREGTYIKKINITYGFQHLISLLALDSVNSFYHRHQDVIQEKQFVYNGTQYRYDKEKSECEIILPGASKLYLRVGDDYYEKVPVPNKYKDLEVQLHRRNKITISDDHGKAFLNHIKKYKAFCNVPDHVSYQEVIHNCFNMYSPFDWEPDEGECPVTLDFLKHIFEEHYDFGLDYVQLLYQRPTQILPILCLVSKENATGKSTFAKWLKAVFKQNMAIVGNAELSSDFNGAYATKLLTACDEAFIDKKTVIEKIKSLSTADRITLNQKGKDHVEIEFFGKFLLLTNNEDNFIYASEDDIRYWVRKIRKPEKERVSVLSDMIAEIPSFLNFLNKRPMKSQNETRMWFHPRHLVTDALKRVVAHSKPMIEKEIRIKLENMFQDFTENIIYLTLGDVRKELLNNRFEEKYIDNVLRENLGVDNYWEPDPAGGKKYKVKRYSFPKWHTIYVSGNPESSRIDVKATGRPFVFFRPDFISAEKERFLQHDPEMLQLANSVPEHYWREGMLDMNKLTSPNVELPF